MFKECLENVRKNVPLVHNITNYVTVNDVANVLLACGGSPIMSDDIDDVVDITSICGGLNINIGTLNKNTIPSMFAAGKKANELGHVVLLDPVGAGASALRTNTANELMEKVKFDVVRGNISEVKTLMVGSIKENDGKSTVTANIALNLARRGKKVVLVDCDMRHPSLAKIFDATVDPKEQFSEYLLGKCELDKVLKRTEVQAHPIYCIWQKKAVAKPYRLLESERFASLIHQLKEQFDYVVMDTPPLELIRDAEIISETADAMLMVMCQDEVHAVAVNDAVDLLEENGVTVIGGVLNMTKGERNISKDRESYGKYYNENAKKNAGE